ncbi:MAG: glycosyltransferase family 39 protein [Planctomycetes bacterium]|nr:glycosyltransferase family 39 protein [Planctomycetota bacterium]
MLPTVPRSVPGAASDGIAAPGHPLWSPLPLGSLIGLLLLFAVLSTAGIRWGLPSRKIDAGLFGAEPPWPGEKIYRLANAGDKFTGDRGADVDVDPRSRREAATVPLTATDGDIARIYLRYRLYTYQPDEMITMMALARMRPGQWDFDPRLYQYGGLFLYPVAALIRLCGAMGLIDVRSDVVFYLDHPEEFAKFYVVARAYSAAWGAVGLLLVFAITRRLGGQAAGLLAATLFAFLPVVVCMAHEGKPHLPGATLMLAAVWFAMRLEDARASALSPDRNQHGAERSRPAPRAWWLMCSCCGAAVAMVLSSWPIMVLIPLIAWPRRSRQANEPASPRAARLAPGAIRPWLVRTAGGSAVAAAVYVAANPYVVINIFANREVLRSNFGNSLAMYEVARVAEGLMRVLSLTVEGATLPVALLGAAALFAAALRKQRGTLPLIVPAVAFFLQFVLIGAGKPAEYGRFGVFTNAALAIGCACVLAPSRPAVPRRWRSALVVLTLLWVAACGNLYLTNFRTDATDAASRLRARRAGPLDGRVTDNDAWTSLPLTVAVPAEPAPYSCPPLPFNSVDVRLTPNAPPRDAVSAETGRVQVLLRAVDATDVGPRPTDPGSTAGERPSPLFARLERVSRRWFQTPISWANKPVEVWHEGRVFAP